MPIVSAAPSSDGKKSATNRIVGIQHRESFRTKLFEQARLWRRDNFPANCENRDDRGRTLVMHAASNSMPAVRDCANAWLETSTTACEQPLAAIRANQSASTGAGGVVMSLGSNGRAVAVDNRARQSGSISCRLQACWQ